jgi:hypothetical protein
MTTPALAPVFMEMLPAGGRRPAGLEDVVPILIGVALQKHGFDFINEGPARRALEDAIMAVLSQVRAQHSYQLNDQLDRLLTHGFGGAAAARDDAAEKTRRWIEEDRRRKADESGFAPSEEAA